MLHTGALHSNSWIFLRHIELVIQYICYLFVPNTYEQISRNHTGVRRRRIRLDTRNLHHLRISPSACLPYCDKPSPIQKRDCRPELFQFRQTAPRGFPHNHTEIVENRRRLRFLCDNNFTVVSSTGFANSVCQNHLSALRTFGQRRRIELPGAGTSFISSCFRYFPLRYCHFYFLPYFFPLLRFAAINRQAFAAEGPAHACCKCTPPHFCLFRSGHKARHNLLGTNAA